MIKTNISSIIILATLLFTACNIHDNATVPNGRIKVEAYFEEDSRVSLTQNPDSPGMVARWQENDAVKVFLSNGGSVSDAGACRIEDISEDGHKALFYYSIPDDFRIGVGLYNLYALSINSYPMVTDWELQCNGSIIRSPLSSFRAPVLFESDTAGSDSYGYFRHFGTYELLHVANDSDADISFSLSGFQAGTIWYRSKGALKIPSMEFMVSSEAARAPVDASEPITIPAHGSDVIVSWYIPNGQAIKEARLFARINGETMHTANLLNSDVIPQIGHAYHMYVSWDGKSLSYTKNSTAPLEVVTDSATFDPDSFTCSLAGSVTNSLAVDVKSAGFRIWKDDEPEDYVEYAATLSEDNTFSLSLKYADFREIAGEGAIKGLYKVSAFALRQDGSRFHGGIIGFTVNKERPDIVAINVDPASLEFGFVPVGTSASKTVIITNCGEGSLRFSLSCGREEFSFTPEEEVVLGVGESCEATVTFTPAEEMDYSGNLIVSSNASDSPEMSIPLHGEGIAVEFNADISISTKYLFLLSGLVGSISTRDVTVSNPGTNLLRILSVSCTEGVSTDFESWGETIIRPGESKVLKVTLVRKEAKYYNETVTICSNASDNSILTIKLYGYSLEIITPEAVDLGLSVKWGSMNLGAKREGGNGLYFSWGETEPKDDYTWENYKWYYGNDNNSAETVIKYNLFSYADHYDGKSRLEPEDDAAHVLLGGRWRMPTKEEAQELIKTKSNSDYEWIWVEKKGLQITYLPNGNSIFLNSTGYAYGESDSSTSNSYYWTSTVYPECSFDAWRFGCDDYYKILYISKDGPGIRNRICGLAIRPVCD